MPDPAAVNSMFGRIARRYDLANRLLSGGIDLWWRYRLVRAVKKQKPETITDLATGSGDVAFALCKALPPETEITGMDFCQPMLDQAEKKKQAKEAATYAKISFFLGDAMAIPLPDNSTDAVTISFGLRNIADRNQALCEMHRILKKEGGRLFVLEFSQPYPWFRPFYFFYLKHILPSIAALCTGDKSAYDYLCGSIEEFPNRNAISLEIQAAGFSKTQAIPLMLGSVALHIADV
ncbi:MAG: bifunctional demethylmenaquinone methyltransferase/2-methoxy-6-polyprenyl-1,4-benzoquinol methylase UbiE [Opitutaceae bacterium]|nr:bifunctional demethylmenaquinone methyltransferase/2-methoxy-6-polyprenyl-1,4-benzoquinol methylase UbiE [Opitutaceae bacterium]